MGVLNFRKYARVEVEIPISFFLPGSEELIKAAYLSNLSEEGAALICPFILPIATTLDFDIRLPKQELPAHAKAEVLWYRPIQEQGKHTYVHGLLFSRVEVDDRQRLHEFISQAMSY